MKTKLLRSLLLAASIAAAGTSSLASAAVDQPLSFLGTAAPAGTAVDQVIVLNDGVASVNVTSGSTVKFVIGDRSFIWTFDNGAVPLFAFDLNRIAPAGLLDHQVTTYVSYNPLYPFG
jgi:hypothetical protein